MKLWKASFALLLTVLASSSQAAEKLTIGTGGTGGVYHVLGEGIAKLLSQKIPDVQITAQSTGASVDNLLFIRSNKVDMGLSMADAAWDSLQGEGKFKNEKVNVRVLAALYANYMHVVTLERNGISVLANLGGKRVSTGSPGSGTEVTAVRLLELAGVDKTVVRERLGVAESVEALKNGNIDAFFWVSGIPAPAVTGLAAALGTQIKFIDHAEWVSEMNKKYVPLYSKGVLAADSYPNQRKPVNSLLVWNLLVVDAKMNDELAYKITQTLMENQPELIKAHKEAVHISIKNQGATSPIPYHPGAKRYFKEKGITVQ